MIAESDREGSGTISFDTFQAVMAGKMHARDPRDEAVKAFRLFDDDETGEPPPATASRRLPLPTRWSLPCARCSIKALLLLLLAQMLLLAQAPSA